MYSTGSGDSPESVEARLEPILAAAISFRQQERLANFARHAAKPARHGRINNSDIDLGNALLTVRQTKFFKMR
jgi:hypothetical protein